MRQDIMEEKHIGGEAWGVGCTELSKLVSYPNGDVGQATGYTELLGQMFWRTAPMIRHHTPLSAGVVLSLTAGPPRTPFLVTNPPGPETPLQDPLSFPCT